MAAMGMTPIGTGQKVESTEKTFASRLMAWGTLSALPWPGALAVIVVLIGISWGVTIPLGGAGIVAPHWFYIPIFMAGLRFGPLGALVAGGSSMIIAGPLLPLSFSPTVAQATSDWVSRGIFFIVIGQFVTLLFGALRQTSQAEAFAVEHARALTEAQAALVRRERLSAVGEMTTVIGHELRNPLGAVINLLFLVRSGLTDENNPELDGYLGRAESETNRAAALSEDLIAYMQERDPVIVPLELRAVVDEVLRLSPAPPGIEVCVEDLGSDVQADRGQLVQVLTKLLTNAYQAMPDGGSLGVGGTQSDGFVEITVEDSGVGIDPAVAERLLEPFFTTKPTGTGLGLAIVKRFAEGHNGTVSIEGGPTVGARVTIRLPHTTAGPTP
jgi:signal transduction histidine kinase